MKLLVPFIFLHIGLIACNSNKKEPEVVTMKSGDIKIGPVIHDSLSADQMEKIKKIHSVFAEVYPVSLEESVINFRRDMHPDKEIGIWSNMASAYERFLSHTGITDSVKKKDAFKLLLLRSMMPEDQAIEEAEVKSLSVKQVKDLLQYYNSDPSPITVKQE